ncbi:MAG TPA: HAD-IA family hydrolase [Thermoanaerobaculia bacterium]|nr:HAD-IA family hydrolase [Thermoanaerobaculia bacterium]
MLRYRAVLFDLDGTLVDSYAALTDAVNFAVRQHGIGDLSPQTIRSYVGEGLEVLMQRVFAGGIPDGAIESFERRYDAICCEQSRVLDDVEPTLAELEACGVAMAVCTNKPTAFSKKILESLGLTRFFRDIVGPDLAGARKPARQHVLRTLEATGCAAAQALFVGDMPIDVQAARNSGLDVAVVATGSSSPSVLHAAAPDHYLDHLADLVQVVRPGAIA